MNDPPGAAIGERLVAVEHKIQHAVGNLLSIAEATRSHATREDLQRIANDLEDAKKRLRAVEEAVARHDRRQEIDDETEARIKARHHNIGAKVSLAISAIVALLALWRGDLSAGLRQLIGIIRGGS